MKQTEERPQPHYFQHPILLHAPDDASQEPDHQPHLLKLAKHSLRYLLQNPAAISYRQYAEICEMERMIKELKRRRELQKRWQEWKRGYLTKMEDFAKRCPSRKEIAKESYRRKGARLVSLYASLLKKSPFYSEPTLHTESPFQAEPTLHAQLSPQTLEIVKKHFFYRFRFFYAHQLPPSLSPPMPRS